MSNKHKNYKLAFLIIPAAIVLTIVLLVQHHNFGVLNPAGPIAHQERNLIVTGILLMLVVAIPMLATIFLFAWKYRDTNTQANYAPDWHHNTELEFVRWGVPAVIILVLAIIMWKSTHQLDPFRPLESSVPPITIEVVALQWKWLFIYPKQNIATVNFLEFPQNTPVNFELTADAPMSSFWIPQLGGQMYAMAGMSTQLHLMASVPGTFAGSAAEINGPGFAGMRFPAVSASQNDFDNWVQSIKQKPDTLTYAEYNKLSAPTTNNPADYYSSVDQNLYSNVIMKFMPASSSMPGMDMGATK